METKAPEYCIVITSDGRRRKMRAPQWWVNARDPRVVYPEGYVPEYTDRPPWVANTGERRFLKRMVSTLVDATL